MLGTSGVLRGISLAGLLGVAGRAQAVCGGQGGLVECTFAGERVNISLASPETAWQGRAIVLVGVPTVA